MPLQCPVCGSENLTGAELCDNCGAELGGHDVPTQASSFEGRLMGEHLADLGTTPPMTVSPEATLDAVIAGMRDRDADCVLVVDGERLVGIFTDRDAILKVAGKHLASLQVGDHMTRDPVVLRHDDTIAVAIHKMAVGGFRHIPILHHGRPTGVITARDVFHHLARVLG